MPHYNAKMMKWGACGMPSEPMQWLYKPLYKAGLVLNCFHYIWWYGKKWCGDGWNVTQTERMALKEHINILDCVQRVEWSRAVCMNVCAYVCTWGGGNVSVHAGVRACVQMLMDWSLLHWSHWFSHAGIQSQDVTHTPPHMQRKHRSFSEPLLECLKLRKPNSSNIAVCYVACIQNISSKYIWRN